MEFYTLNYDGSCWPNPGGKAGCGYILRKEGQIVKSDSIPLGDGPLMSNNYAEFMGVFHGLTYFMSLNPIKGAAIQVLGDSQFVYKMCIKKFKATSAKLYYPAWIQVDKLVKQIRKQGHLVMFDWIPREMNQEADNLSR